MLRGSEFVKGNRRPPVRWLRISGHVYGEVLTKSYHHGEEPVRGGLRSMAFSVVIVGGGAGRHDRGGFRPPGKPGRSHHSI